MAEISKSFLGWLICFGLISFGVIVGVHLVLRRVRAAQKLPSTNSSAESSVDSATRLSFAGRVLLVLAVGGFYLGVLGPLVGKVFAFLNATPVSQSTSYYSDPDGTRHSHLAGVSMELDSLGRPKLLPVPDPISAD